MSPIMNQYSLKGHVLKNEDWAKYLGVDIQTNLMWNKHIDRSVKKSNCMLGFLRRNLKIKDQETKSSAYFSLVRPSLEYCCTVWSPYTKDNIKKVHMVLRRAARYATNRYRNTSSVSDMLRDLHWTSLEDRRSKHQLVMIYTIVHGCVDIPACQYLTAPLRRNRLQDDNNCRQYQAKSDVFKYSFFPKTVVLWNSLPATIA
jgi:hypothetical protein